MNLPLKELILPFFRIDRTELLLGEAKKLLLAHRGFKKGFPLGKLFFKELKPAPLFLIARPFPLTLPAPIQSIALGFAFQETLMVPLGADFKELGSKFTQIGPGDHPPLNQGGGTAVAPDRPREQKLVIPKVDIPLGEKAPDLFIESFFKAE